MLPPRLSLFRSVSRFSPSPGVLAALVYGALVFSCSTSEDPDGEDSGEEDSDDFPDDDGQGGESGHEPGDGDGGGTGETGSGGSAALACVEHGGTCELVECDFPEEVGLHVETCSVLTPHTNPPSSGPHYPVWAAFQKYDFPVPRGYWIHSLEHSGVVLTYNCSEAEAAGIDCAEMIDELEEFFDTWPADPKCTATRHRLLLTPDPLLDAPFAASAWGHTLKGRCFDGDVVSAFIEEHYGKTYEDICTAGLDVSVTQIACGR